MPGLSGFQACEAIRARSRVPVMMLTVRGEEEDLVRALELGADDYLTKPFSPRTLVARIRALLRRAGMENTAPVAAGRITLDLGEHTVRIGSGEAVRLTKLGLAASTMRTSDAYVVCCAAIAILPTQRKSVEVAHSSPLLPVAAAV